MGSKNKLFRFDQIKSFKNVYEGYDFEAPKLTSLEKEDLKLKGKWSKTHFNNENPLTLELACGKGEYACSMAKNEPHKNFLAVDIKGARIFIGAKQGLEEKIPNLAFLRTRIELIENFLEENEVSEIWITFPDPFYKKPSRRLTSPFFLEIYRKFLSKDGKIHLKTDDEILYEYTLEIIKENSLTLHYESNDIYSKELIDQRLEIKTYFEGKHLKKGLKIKYIVFSL